MIGLIASPAPMKKAQREAKNSSFASLFDLWNEFRNRLLVNPHFQRKAATLPLVRIIARRKARDLFDLCSGFVYSQVLLACVRLKLFHALAEAPRSVSEASILFGLPEDSMKCLLEAAESLDLLHQRNDGCFTLGTYGAAFLANPGIEKMVEHNVLLYEDLHDPVAFLKNSKEDTALSRYWTYSRAKDPTKLTDREIKDYSSLMSATQPLVAEEILDSYPFHKHTHLLDVGGGEGLFLCAAGKRFPHLTLTLFDLPSVIARAHDNFCTNKFGRRAQALGGNFFKDALPSGADIVTLVRILHDHGEDKVHQLLVNIHNVLPPHGRLLIGEPLAKTPGAEPMGAAYFGLYLKAMGSGRPRSASDIQQMLEKAGFSHASPLPTRFPLQTSLIVATP